MVEKFCHAISVDERLQDFDWSPAIAPPTSDSEQRLFPGGHSDVGGSYQERGLGQGPFVWLLGEMQSLGLHVPWSVIKGVRATPLRRPDQIMHSPAAVPKYKFKKKISKNDSDACRHAVTEQLETAPNACGVQHFPHKNGVFKIRPWIHRSIPIDLLLDLTIDKSFFNRTNCRGCDYEHNPIFFNNVIAWLSERKRKVVRGISSAAKTKARRACDSE